MDRNREHIYTVIICLYYNPTAGSWRRWHSSLFFWASARARRVLRRSRRRGRPLRQRRTHRRTRRARRVLRSSRRRGRPLRQRRTHRRIRPARVAPRPLRSSPTSRRPVSRACRGRCASSAACRCWRSRGGSCCGLRCPLSDQPGVVDPLRPGACASAETAAAGCASAASGFAGLAKRGTLRRRSTRPL